MKQTEVRALYLSLQKCCDFEIRVRGHSRSSEPTQIDLPPTIDLLLTFHSNRGPISYRFRDKRQFPSKIAKFLHLRVFAPPMNGFPLELGTGAGGQRYRDEKEVWRYLEQL